MAGYRPFPACLLSKGTVTSILLPISVTFDKDLEVLEVLKFKQAHWGGGRKQLRGNRP